MGVWKHIERNHLYFLIKKLYLCFYLILCLFVFSHQALAAEFRFQGANGSDPSDIATVIVQVPDGVGDAGSLTITATSGYSHTADPDNIRFLGIDQGQTRVSYNYRNGTNNVNVSLSVYRNNPSRSQGNVSYNHQGSSYNGYFDWPVQFSGNTLTIGGSDDEGAEVIFNLDSNNLTLNYDGRSRTFTPNQRYIIRPGSLAVFTHSEEGFSVQGFATGFYGSITITETSVLAGNFSGNFFFFGATSPDDFRAPVITLNGEDEVSLEVGETYEEAGATATDDKDGEVNVTLTGSVDSSVAGVYEITYSASDAAGNTASITREVTVIEPADTTLPVIALNGDAEISLNQGEDYIEAGASATDDRDGTLNVQIFGNVATDTVGVYTLTYTAADAAGNTAQATRTVNVLDATPPVITLFGGSSIEIGRGNAFVDPSATAVDAEDGEVEVTASGSVDTSLVGSYTLTYAATDTAGNEAKVTRTVNVVEFTAEDHGITVSDVSGHTAYYNAVADFNVVLNSQPVGDVIIPVSSTDTSEGIVLNHEAEGITQLTFTPDNWNRYQKVVVKGRNPNVVDGQQDYSVVLGAAESFDSNYNGTDPIILAMSGIKFSLYPPDMKREILFSGEKVLLNVGISRSVSSTAITYELLDGPNGMTLRSSKSSEFGPTLVWTPTDADMGKTYTVKVQATDGQRTTSTSFPVKVAMTSPLQATATDTIATITDNATDLSGLQVELIDHYHPVNAASFRFSKVNPDGLPYLGGTPVTDVFRIQANEYEEEGFDEAFVRRLFQLDRKVPEIKVRIPLSNLPEGIDPKTHKVELMFWAMGFHSKLPRTYWERQRGKFVTVNGESYVEFTFTKVDTVFYIHIDGRYAARHRSKLATNLEEASNRSRPQSLCKPVSEEAPDYREQICTSPYDTTKSFIVKDFGGAEYSTQWGNITIDEMAGWLFYTQSLLDGMGMNYDSQIEVHLETREEINRGSGVGGTLGYISNDIFSGENAKILHLLSSDDFFLRRVMQGTVVHEYFHHAQARSLLASQENMLLTSTLAELRNRGLDDDDKSLPTRWFIEGSARWFEDKAYDQLDSYSLKAKQGNRILEVGLNRDGWRWFYPEISEEGRYKRDKRDDPYHRVTFFKLLESKCNDGFSANYLELINNNDRAEPSGIKNMIDDLANAGCDFGRFLGEGQKGSFATALLYYQYATLYQNKISLLDSNEQDVGSFSGGFGFDPTPYAFEKADWFLSKVSAIDGVKIDQIKEIPPYGAFSLKINESMFNNTLEEGKEVALKISASGNLLVSLLNTSEPDAQLDSDKHTWFRTDDTTLYTFGEEELTSYFITLVNDSAFPITVSELSFQLHDVLPLKKTQISGTSVDGADDTYQKGVADNYTRDSFTETVSDHVTGLMWQDNMDVVTLSKPFITQENYDNEDFANTEGDTAVNYCQNLELGGFKDWRLPTLKQFMSIISYKNVYHTIDQSVFQHSVAAGTDITDTYWTATHSDSTAYRVSLRGGETRQGYKSTPRRIRCVRHFQ